jgi:hypothetical protein
LFEGDVLRVIRAPPLAGKLFVICVPPVSGVPDPPDQVPEPAMVMFWETVNGLVQLNEPAGKTTILPAAATEHAACTSDWDPFVE